jgi:peptide/nickel transport system substrate-binding protein
MKQRRRFGHARIAGVLFSVVALLGVSTGTGAVASAAPAPKKGGTIRYLYTTETAGGAFGTVGVQQAPNTNEHFAIFDALVVLTTSTTVQYRLAESLTSNDNIVWTMKLRRGVKFSDGTPFDASAVKFNWDFKADPANAKVIPTGVTAFAEFASTQVVDPLTLKITLKSANGIFPETLSYHMGNFVGSPTAMRALGAAEFNLHPVGAGAFMFSDWTRGSSFTVVRNPNYYIKGLPYLDKIVFQYVGDDAQRYNTLLSGGGEINYTAVLPTQARGKSDGYALTTVEPAGGIGLRFNFSSPPFDDIRARRAVTLALDFDSLNQAVFGGFAKEAKTFFPKGSRYYHAGATQATPNAKKAQALFDELAAEGKPVTFSFLSTSTEPFSTLTKYVGARLASFRNVKMTEDIRAGSGFLAPYIAKTYGIFDGSFTTDPVRMCTVFCSDGTTNRTGYANPATDAAFAAFRNATSAAAKKEAMDTAQEVLVKDIVDYFVARASNGVLYKKSVVTRPPMLNDGVIDWARASLRKSS